jgi:hypothetical protein
MDGDENFDIDPEIWLTYLLAVNGDGQEKKKLVDRVSKKAGIIPEKTELILDELVKFLVNKSRSN